MCIYNNNLYKCDNNFHCDKLYFILRSTHNLHIQISIFVYKICTLCLSNYNNKIIHWASAYNTRTVKENKIGPSSTSFVYYGHINIDICISQWVYYVSLTLTIKLSTDIVLTKQNWTVIDIFRIIRTYEYWYLYTAMGTLCLFNFNDFIVYWYSTH